MITVSDILRISLSFGVLLLAGGCVTADGQGRELQTSDIDPKQQETQVLIQYLEIVTPEVEATCRALSEAHGVTFTDPAPELGGARTAELRGGGRIGVRAPLADHEYPLIRPYVLVEDIDAAVAAAKAAGAEIAMTPTEIPGQGKFAIYILGGIQHGVWQL